MPEAVERCLDAIGRHALALSRSLGDDRAEAQVLVVWRRRLVPRTCSILRPTPPAAMGRLNSRHPLRCPLARRDRRPMYRRPASGHQPPLTTKRPYLIVLELRRRVCAAHVLGGLVD